MFLNPDRVTNADIDTDYSNKDREKVKQFLLKDHMDIDGLHCAEIITFNTIAKKGAIKDIGRAFDMSIEETQKISDAVKLVDGKWVVEDDIKKSYKQLFEYVDIVEGTIVSVGSHPSGVLISDLDIQKTIGLSSLSSSEYPVTSLNMKELDELMYVKLDILGLDNVGVINETCELAGIQRLTPDNVDFEDEKVWKSIRDDTTMIFQWESNGAQAYLKKFMSDETIEKVKNLVPNFNYLKWLSFGNGLIRPSCASFRNDVAEGKFYDNGMDELNKFLSPTLGRVAMQEDIMRWLKEFCGYNDAEADTARRCLDENTIIKMADNTTKKISDINIGDFVISYNKYGVSEPKIVNYVFDNGIQECFELKTQHGYSIIGTAEHKVLTQNGYIKIGDLSCDDYVMVPTKLNYTNDKLRPNQRLSCSDMFLIGCLIGDGYIGRDSLNFVNSDENLINKYKKCVNNRIKNSTPCEFGDSYQIGISVDKIYTITIKSKNYRDSVKGLLSKYNLLNALSKDKYIHDSLMKYPVGSKLASLLGGLFSTDGGYNTNGNYIDYSSRSYRLVGNIRDLLLKFGIYSYISKTNVSEYGYFIYRLIITQNDSLDNFRKEILPYVVGYKWQKFYDITYKKSELSYNYLLPNEFTKEIFNNLKNSQKSLRGTGIEKISKESKITDKKAKKIIETVYCPKTYKMLMSEYMPVKIKEINHIGRRHVFDLEIEGNHNYIANNIIVHNCIAKKKGTESLLPEIHDRFIKYSHEKFGTPKEQLENTIKPFLQTILDASSYAFSWNHSDAYSSIGYICGYLRYYYPLEFITSALNIFSENEEKTKAITDYASKNKIRIKNVKFGYSKSDYFFDKEEKAIYKGVGSIKYLNRNVANQLFELSRKKYSYFSDLLIDINNNTDCNSRQLEALIRLDYFSEFGNSKELSLINEFTKQFKYGTINKYKKDKVPEDTFLFNLFNKYATDIGKNGQTLKSYTIIDPISIIHGCEEDVKKRRLEDYPITTKIEVQKEYLGYISLATGIEKDRRKLYIKKAELAKTKADGRIFGLRIFTISIGSGKESMFVIPKNGMYNYETRRREISPLEKCGEVTRGDVVYVKKYTSKKGKDGRMYFNLIDYDIL